VTRRVRLVRARLGYEGGLVLHTASSGPVPALDEIRLVVEEDGRLVALGATRTNIAYLAGTAQETIEAAILDVAADLDWSLPWPDLVVAMDARWPGLVAPARMLFEMAARDGAARERGVTVGETFGGGEIIATPTNQTLFWQDDASLLARAEAYVARSFTELKLRIGIGSFEDDLRRLRALRERFGDVVRLSVDANGTWSASEAPARLETLARIGLDYVEQPLAFDAWEETAALSRVSPIPIMLDEALGSMAAIRRLAETRAAPLAHLKLAKLGGLDRMAEAASLLKASDIGIMVGQMNEGAVSTAAVAQIAVALDAPYRELYGADGLTGEAASPALTYRDGLLHLPPGPGLGLGAYPIDPTTPVLWDSTT
jgi:L-alanine-DL-glutamate epimerase-like enolase superfamily enzyme